jgi:hypothetical protein
MLKPIGTLPSTLKKSYRHYISDFETGGGELSLPVLLKYARVANI